MMIADKQSAAIARYMAMAGRVKKLPPKARRRARLDQKRYAVRYLTVKRGKGVVEDLKLIRFMVEVCGLTLQEAGRGVRKARYVRGFGSRHVPGPEEAARVAKSLYRQTGDLIDAVSLARFYGWSCGEGRAWNAVCVALSRMTVTRESTGIENWAEAAE
jgi:hypothetical protein